MVTDGQPRTVDGPRVKQNAPREFPPLPVPSPDTVRAARARLAGRFSTGVDALLWEEAGHPMHDAQAISAVVSSADGADGSAPGALDFGAALIVLASLRLDIDRLEVDLVDAIRDAGLDWEFVARTLHLSVQQVAKRQRLLSKRRALPTDRVHAPATAQGRAPHDGQPGPAASGRQDENRARTAASPGRPR
jgi:hypothetical protein